YTAIKEPAHVLANQSNVVPFTFYLPKIEPLNTMINTDGPTEVTNAKVPGLKMTIPQGIKLRKLQNGADVTHVSITPVPVDRTPAPIPPNTAAAMVYTSQPGNACIFAGGQCVPTDINNGPQIPVTYPNLSGASPGTQMPLYAFDHGSVSWYQYGTGTVSPDGKTIEPNINPATGQKFGLRDFSWHYPSITPDGNPGDDDEGGNGPGRPCQRSRGGDPVDYSTGMKIETMTDIAVGGARGGLSLTRTYTTDLANPVGGISPVYRFGVGFKDNYDVRLTGTFQTGGAGRVIWPEQLSGRLFSYDAALSAGGTATFRTRAPARQLA